MPLVTREDKGSPLSHEEMDENWRLAIAADQWIADVQYAVNALTTHNGVIYRSLTLNTNKVPPTNPSDWVIYGTPLPPLEVGDADYVYLAEARDYHRHIATGAKTGEFSGSLHYPHVYNISNRAASGNLTLSGDGITLNPPKGGTLVLEPGDTVRVTFTSPTEADVSGSTVPE